MILTICIFGVLFSLCPFNSIATACAAGGAQSWSCNAFAWDPEDGRWKMWYLKHPKTSYLYNDFYCRFVGILRNGMCSSIFFLALVLTQPATWLSYKLSYKYLKMHQNRGMVQPTGARTLQKWALRSLLAQRCGRKTWKESKHNERRENNIK